MTTDHLGQLGHILVSCGLDPAEVLALRHTYNDGGLRRGEVTVESMVAYARTQRAGWGKAFRQLSRGRSSLVEG